MVACTMTIVKKSSLFTLIALILLAIIITGCATIQMSTVKTRSNYKKVWNACLDSLPDVHFSASSTDPVSGLIIADQAVVGGHGTVSRLNIRVSKESGSTIVLVKYVPPPGTVGGSGTADRFVNALKQRLPDLEPIIINNTAKTAKSSQQGIKERNGASVGSDQEDTRAMTNENLPVRYLIIIKKSNIRAEGKTKSKIITTPKLGERVEKIDASDKWFKVRTEKGETGWIIKSAVKQAE